jgi:hypothetical protein
MASVGTDRQNCTRVTTNLPLQAKFFARSLYDHVACARERGYIANLALATPAATIPGDVAIIITTYLFENSLLSK